MVKGLETISNALVEYLDSATEKLLLVPKLAASFGDNSLLNYLGQDLRAIGKASVVADALEQLVDVFLVPYCLQRDANPGLVLILSWRELCEGSITRESLSGSFLEEQLTSEMYAIAAALLEVQLPQQGTSRVDTPGGFAELRYRRYEKQWHHTMTTSDGSLLGFAEKFCVATQDVPAGSLARHVSMYDMLIEPREYQLQPDSPHGALYCGNGHVWWPRDIGR